MQDKDFERTVQYKLMQFMKFTISTSDSEAFSQISILSNGIGNSLTMKKITFPRSNNQAETTKLKQPSSKNSAETAHQNFIT